MTQNPILIGTGGSDSAVVGGGLSAPYRFDTDTTAASPSTGHVRYNAATAAATTEIYINDVDIDGVTKVGIDFLRVGDVLKLENTAGGQVLHVFDLTAAPVDNVGWHTLTVTPRPGISPVGEFSNNQQLQIDAIILGAEEFTALTDTPADYSGAAHKVVRVNTGQTGLEFTEIYAKNVVVDPTETTNPDLPGVWQYNTVTQTLWLCLDNTTDENLWRNIELGNQVIGSIIEFAPVGSPTDNQSIESVANQPFFREGALYYIGTDGLTMSYSNVHTSGDVVVTWSGNQVGGSTQTVDRTLNEVYSNNSAGSWVRFDFGTRKLAANRITWQTGRSDTLYRLQNYKIQASNEETSTPTVWADLLTVVNDPPAAIGYAIKDDTFVNTTPYRHYRILSTGVDTSGSNYLMIGDLEFYGTVSEIWTF